MPRQGTKILELLFHIESSSQRPIYPKMAFLSQASIVFSFHNERTTPHAAELRTKTHWKHLRTGNKTKTRFSLEHHQKYAGSNADLL